MPARLPDINTIIQAGINPKTGLPLKLGGPSKYKEAIKRLLRVQDEQQAIRRYKWFNLPDGLDSELVERILYYKYSGAFFYDDKADRFYFLPYVLRGNIDVYGRYNAVSFMPFNGTSEIDKHPQKKYLHDIVREPMTSVQIEEFTWRDWTTKCVILNDYAKQISQTALPRQYLNDEIIDIEAEMIPFMRTSLQNQTGTAAVRTNNQDEQFNVMALNQQVQNAALNGIKYLAAIGAVDFQNLDSISSCKPADFMQAMESLDNFRLQCLGIDSNGLFQKKAHMLGAEQAQAAGATGFILDDGLLQRQEFCDKVNSLFGLGIWCELSENAVGDTNLDGIVADEEDQSGEPGTQPENNNIGGDE